MRATREVEKSISRRLISPSLVSKVLLKGSVEYSRKPLVVPMEVSKSHIVMPPNLPIAKELWS